MSGPSADASPEVVLLLAAAEAFDDAATACDDLAGLLPVGSTDRKVVGLMRDSAAANCATVRAIIRDLTPAPWLARVAD